MKDQLTWAFHTQKTEIPFLKRRKFFKYVLW